MAVLSVSPIAALPSRATRNVSRRCSRRSTVMSTEETPAPAPEPATKAPVNLTPKFYAREILNSRTAMVGFVAALATELKTHETVLAQLDFQKHSSDTFWLVSAVALVFLSSQFPVWNNSKADGLNQKANANGPFTPMAEIINGRAAMIGFASLMFTEALKGSSVF